MRYEIWVKYAPPYRIPAHKVYEQGRYWARRAASKAVVKKQTFHNGINDIMGLEPAMKYYVWDTWRKKHYDL